MMPQLTLLGPGSVCRLRLSGSMRRVVVLSKSSILGEMNSIRAENIFAISGRATFRFRTLRKTASSVSLLSKPSHLTVSASTLWQETHGNGAPIGSTLSSTKWLTELTQWAPQLVQRAFLRGDL